MENEVNEMIQVLERGLENISMLTQFKAFSGEGADELIDSHLGNVDRVIRFISFSFVVFL